MKIGIDCRLWNETGIGRYIRNIVTELSILDKKNSYILFMLPQDIVAAKSHLPPNFSIRVADVRWYTFFEQILMPVLLYREKLDVFFCPSINFPIFYLKKSVITIHDLTPFSIKTGRASTRNYAIYRLKLFMLKFLVLYSARFCTKVFTVSTFIKNEIHSKLHVPLKKIVVTPNSVDVHFSPISPEQIHPILRKYGIQTPYIFYVGNAHPHKNLQNLIDAFGKLIVVDPSLNLVLAGKHDFFYKRLQSENMHRSYFGKISFPGFIEDSDLPALYSGCSVFANPSLYEGFGIQLLEAFACGAKAACSNTTSLPEIGGNVAFYFNPRDVNGMAAVILQASKDMEEKRIIEGKKICLQYSWNRSAQKILESL